MQLALTGLGRVFIQKGSRNCGSFYKYHSTMKIDGVDKTVGDVTPIYVPDPKRYDAFIEAGTISGAESRATSTLTGYLPLNNKGALEDLYNQKCAFDLQIHFGSCTRPDDFNEFDSVVVLKDVRFTSYGMSTLTARGPEERAAIDETAAISIGSFYRVFNTEEAVVRPPTFVADTFPIAILNAGPANCGDDCDDRTDGCSVWIAPYINDDATVSFAITLDNGVTWTAQFSNSGDLHLGTAAQVDALVDGGFIYYVTASAAISRLYKVSIDSLLNGNADTIRIAESEATTPVTLIYRLAASDNYIWMVGGDGATEGAIYTYNKYTRDTVEYRYTSADFFGIDVYDENHVVVVGDDDTVYYSTVHGVFGPVAIAPTSTNYISSVHMFSKSHWVIGASGGIYCTSNYGASWTKRNTTTGTVRLAFYDDILGYAVDDQGTLRTLDSGNTWLRVHNNVNEQNHNIVICQDDPNIYWASSGEAATPGFLIKGVA